MIDEICGQGQPEILSVGGTGIFAAAIQPQAGLTAP